MPHPTTHSPFAEALVATIEARHGSEAARAARVELAETLDRDTAEDEMPAFAIVDALLDECDHPFN